MGTGNKANKCCCCPNCTYRVELCCPCVCPAICVTFTPDDYADCDPESVELDWDNAINGYQGTLHGHDLYYYIERDPPAYGQERGPCKFKLRSESLGYPEGYEYEWEIPCDPYDEEVPCTTCLALQTEIAVPADEYNECAAGTITTECVRWVTPTNCDNCFCLCECLCAFVTKDGISYSGKLCWDDYTLNRWTGTLTGLDQYGAEVSLDMRVEMDRWGDVCDPDTDDDCDPYDDSCAINAYIEDDAGDIAGNWQKMAEPCELRAVNYSWHIERDPYNDEDDIEITIRCATCNEDCDTSIAYIPCCESYWPTTLTLSFQWRWWDMSGYSELYDYTFPITLEYIGRFGWYSGHLVIDPPYWSNNPGYSVDVRFWFSIEEPHCQGRQIIYKADGTQPAMTPTPPEDAEPTLPTSEPPFDTVDCDNIPTPLWTNPPSIVVCCDPPLIWCPHAPWFDPLVTE